AVDAAGNAYVSGQTNAPDFPLQNAVQPVWGGGGCNTGSSYYPCYDAFVTKLRPDGAALVYSTYLGGDRDEAYYYVEHGGLAIDAAGHAYVTGYTESLNFPTYHALQPNKGSPRTAYVSKLSPDGAAFVYSTYLGGKTSGGVGYGIAADPAGHAYVT